MTNSNIFSLEPIAEPIVSPLGDMPDDAHKPNISMRAVNGAHQGNPGLSEAQVRDLISQAVGNATSAAMGAAQKQAHALIESVEQKAADLLGQITKAASARSLVMHVKLGQAPIAGLSREAHPILGQALLTAKSLHDAKIGAHVLFVGPAGSGKGMLAEQLAEGLKLPFAQVCMTAGASETWLFGRQTPNGFIEAPFSKFYRDGGLFFIDEIDAADSNLLLAINTALANGVLFNPISGETIKQHADFYCVAASNTFGKGSDAVYTARSRLDYSTLDRFVPIEVDYLEEIERKILPDDALRSHCQEVRAKLKERGALEVVSYRFMTKLAALTGAGFAPTEALGMLTASWPKHIVEETGVLTPPTSNSVSLKGKVRKPKEDIKEEQAPTPVVSF